ncbi:helix-turn-helix domain-containing protein [Candidatus Haliotispira prima]
MSGVAHSYLFYIEHKKKVPALIVLDKLAKALGVSMRDFFE